MKNKTIFHGIFYSIWVLLLFACSEGDTYVSDGNNNNDGDPPPIVQQKVSTHESTESHTDDRRGNNCMDCHYTGNNPYVYQLAGTVYQLDDLTNPYPGATIYFYTGPNGSGTQVGSIEVDTNGNFYSTDTIDFSTGLYPAIVGAQGEGPIYMSNFITHGECNSCHGSNTSPVYIGAAIQEPVQRVSAHGLTDSHTDNRRGENCMTCHTEYVTAGTVYDIGLEDYYANATLYFYTGADGTGELIETLQVDANGNFYTTEPLDFTAGLYPVIEDANGSERISMPTSTQNGACNSCHGVNALPLYVAEKVNQLVSQHGTTNSHTDERRGQDCQQCHSLGNNDYVYTLSGTVYQANNPTEVYPNATILFYNKPEAKGDLVLTVEVDNNGNFYTTEVLDFAEGLYPTVEGNANEAPSHMPFSTTNGACNSCHDGAGVSRILVQGNAVERVSAHGTTFSHTDGRRGANCLGCHAVGGDNAYQYSVAGTVYELDLTTFYPDATLYLYSGPDGSGDLVATVAVDGNGNFYTTELIEVGKGKKGVYPAIVGREVGSQPIYMNERADDGACSSSSCHSINRPPIYYAP